MAAAIPAVSADSVTGEGARTGVGAAMCAQARSGLKAKAWQPRGKRGEMAAPIPAVSPAGEDARTGVGTHEGPFSAQEWDNFKVRSREILRRFANRKRCWERMKRRAERLISGHPGEIVSDRSGGRGVGPSQFA